MRTLRLHQDLYSARAIEESCEVFEAHARVDRREERPYFQLEISAIAADTDEPALAGELANYALALTVEEKRGSHEG